MKLSEKFKEKRKFKTESGIYAMDFVNLKVYEEICRLEATLEEAVRIDKKLFERHTKGESIKMHRFISGFRAIEIYRAGIVVAESRLEELQNEHDL